MQNMILANSRNLTMSSREIAERQLHVEILHKRIGFIYAVEFSDKSLVKIGRIKSPKNRLATLYSLSGATGRQWVSDMLPDCVSAENLAHKHFSKQRKRGEWFAIDFDCAINFLDGFNEQAISEQELELAKNKHDLLIEERANKFFDRLFGFPVLKNVKEAT